MRILLTEDNEQLRDAIREGLEKADFAATPSNLPTKPMRQFPQPNMMRSFSTSDCPMATA
jgi:hypothetical protein